jgi:glycosyltransferase involved in cell wall biosynthesis
MQCRVGVVSNTSWSLYNFRRNLIRSLLEANCKVITFAPLDAYSSKVASLGCSYVPVSMNNKGRNPFQDLHFFLRLVRHFRREKLSCVLTFTPKANIYGCWAARLLGIPAVANVAGLGSVFTSPSAAQRLVKQMYRVALTWPVRTFFQNSDDMALFTSLNIVTAARAELLPGSGVDVEYFAPRAPANSGAISFLFLARLLREKGIEEYVAAARAVKREQPHVEFRILGFTDVQNPSAISATTVKGWTDEGVIRYLGDTSDVRPFIADADCVVLPSYYREGTPRTLLEAASMGKPLITTNMPGCRNAVENGVTGFLVKPRDVRDLVAKMSAIAAMPGDARQQMGQKGREKMILEFDERRILKRYRVEVETIVAAAGR